ncbi:hypothetical protein CPB86DRAFT_779207 [Serendipita vermifera]|nr:hypothetical protein CPB86DRAFT_779207 [Serendipita vermifera]
MASSGCLACSVMGYDRCMHTVQVPTIDTSDPYSHTNGQDLFTSLTSAHSPPSPVSPVASAFESRLVTPRRARLSDQEFAERCFPHITQRPLRQQLLNLLRQPWLAFNQLEPEGSLDFLLRDPHDNHQQCMICLENHRKGSRALGHIRWHLCYRPFVCSGMPDGCTKVNWFVKSLWYFR